MIVDIGKLCSVRFVMGCKKMTLDELMLKTVSTPVANAIGAIIDLAGTSDASWSVLKAAGELLHQERAQVEKLHRDIQILEQVEVLDFYAAISVCARCGKLHGRILFQRFTRPAELNTHWGTCPITKEPILFKGVNRTCNLNSAEQNSTNDSANMHS